MKMVDAWKDILFAWAGNPNDQKLGSDVRKILDRWSEEKKANIEQGKQKVLLKSDCWPVLIDGVLYPSQNEAIRKTGRSYGYVRARRVEPS